MEMDMTGLFDDDSDDSIEPIYDLNTDNMERRVVIAGSADAGKSTMVGVLHSGNKGSMVYDDGKGSARSETIIHDHERKSHHTSSVTNVFVNIKHEDKDIRYTFLDLAGQKKYLRTTAFGIASQFPDIGFVLITAKKGILPMTKDHLNILVSLNIRIAIIVTKIDMIENKTLVKKNVLAIKDYLKKQYGNTFSPKMPVIIRSCEEAKKYSNICTDNLVPCPIFKISSTNGKGYDILIEFMKHLKPMRSKIPIPKESPNFFLDDGVKPAESPCFYIDKTFFRLGLSGIILSGFVRHGMISVGDRLFVGPFGKNGFFRDVTVLSIHDFISNDIQALYAGESGCLRIKSNTKGEILTRKMIRRGTKCIAYNNGTIREYFPVWEFEADICIFHNHTTFTRNKTQVVIHFMNVSQTACIEIIGDTDLKQLRTGDRAKVKFKFYHRPEIVELGDSLVFREGNTQGCGIITSI